MSHLTTWLFMIILSIGMHACGYVGQQTAAAAIFFGGVALGMHQLARALSYWLTPDEDRAPHPELHELFIRQYFDAARDPSNAQLAWRALRTGKNWENRVTKRVPARTRIANALKGKQA